MGNSVKVDKEQLLEILYGISYNTDGSVVQGTEVIRNYTIGIVDGKVHINTYNQPVEVLIDGEWRSVEESVNEECKMLLYSMFSEVHLDSEIILDTDNTDGLSVRSRERVYGLHSKLDENGIHLPREFTWVDGASSTKGVIILPQDDYDKVFIATDPNKNGVPDLVFIDPKVSDKQERPYYEKVDGKTYIYVDHFSGGGGTQAAPYVVSNEEDLDNVRNNLSAYYVQDADIVMSDHQTGSGFDPIGTNAAPFKGFYDGRGFEIKDLFINRASNYCGLFGYVQDNALISRVRLVNVNIKGNAHTGALVGNIQGNGKVYDSAVVSGTVQGASFTGGLIGQAHASTYVARGYSHADVIGTAVVGGFIGNFAGTQVTQCLATGSVTDSTIAKTGTEFGGFAGRATVNLTDDNYFDIDSGLLTSAGSAVGLSTQELKKQSTYSSWDFDLFFIMDSSKNKGYPELRRHVRFTKGKGTESDPFLIYTVSELNQVRHYPWANFKLMNDLTMDYPKTGRGFVGIGFGTGIGSITSDSFYGTFDGNNYTIGGLYINVPGETYVGLFKFFRGVLKNLVLTDVDITGRDNVGAVVGYPSLALVGNSEITNVHVKSFEGSKVSGNSYVGGFAGLTYYCDITECTADTTVKGANCSGGFIGDAWNSVYKVSKCKAKGYLYNSGLYAGGFIGRSYYATGTGNSNTTKVFEDILVDVEIKDCTNYCGGVIGYQYDYYENMTNTTLRRVLSKCKNSVDGLVMNGFIGAYYRYTGSNGADTQASQNYFDRQLVNTANSGNTRGSSHVQGAGIYTANMKHPSTYTDPSWDFNSIWVLDENINDGYPELRLSIELKKPILGFRNQFGDYYTDFSGNILKHLEYGTLVAGSTSDPKPVWLQNNADFPVNQMKVWVDGSTVKQGILVELSLTDNPFVPTDEIIFGGTVPIGDAKKFFVRFSSEVTVTEGGTFDMKAKASPA